MADINETLSEEEKQSLQLQQHQQHEGSVDEQLTTLLQQLKDKLHSSSSSSSTSVYGVAELHRSSSSTDPADPILRIAAKIQQQHGVAAKKRPRGSVAAMLQNEVEQQQPGFTTEDWKRWMNDVSVALDLKEAKMNDQEKEYKVKEEKQEDIATAEPTRKAVKVLSDPYL